MPIVFVCHGIGGIIVQRALTISLKNSLARHRKISDATSAIVLLGTPHDGLQGFERSLRYPKISARDQAWRSALRHRSKRESLAIQLHAIQQAFNDVHPRRLTHVKIVSFAEELPVPGFGLVST